MLRLFAIIGLLVITVAPPAQAAPIEVTCVEIPSALYLPLDFLASTVDVGNLHRVYQWSGQAPGRLQPGTNVFTLISQTTSDAFGVLASYSCGVVDVDCVYDYVTTSQPGLPNPEELMECVETP